MKDYPEYKERERSIYEKRRQLISTQTAIIDNQISQVQLELEAAISKLSFLKEGQSLIQKEYDFTEPLARRGSVSQKELLQIKHRVNDILSEVAITDIDIERFKKSYRELVERRKEIIHDFRQEVVEEIKEVEVNLGQLYQQHSVLKNKIERAIVRSPLSGIVKDLHFNTVGGVVQPGIDIIEIVPIDDYLLVEAKISPKDIGFIQQGMKAVVKITAYDYTVYGGLDGVVEYISADTLKNEKDEDYYRVHVRTNKNYLGLIEGELQIIPGMVTNVDIVTGDKTIMEYLFKPIIRGLKNAMQER